MANPSGPFFSHSSVKIDSNCTGTLAELRHWTRAVAGTSSDLELLLTELVSNAKQHGEDGPITVEVQTGLLDTTVVVTNTSRPPPPLPPTSARPVAVADERGRGLQIAAALADDLSIEQVGPTLTVTAHLPLR